MKILDRYLVGTVLLYSAMVLSVLLTLGGLFVFIGQQDDIGVGDYGAAIRCSAAIGSRRCDS